MRKIAHKINSNVITRNLVLAGCGILVFVFLVNMLLNLFTRHGQIHTVPDFSGMTVEEAVKTGRKSSLKIEINDSIYIPAYDGGVILEQNPSVGSEVKSGRRIFVTTNSFKQRMVKIPYVTGFSLRQAKNNLELAGLEIDKLLYQSDIATNNVIEQRYKSRVITSGSKTEAEAGSGITLVVGLGEGTAAQKIPQVVGFSLREAKSRLWEAGFNVGKISKGEGITPLNEKGAKVYIQSPTAGSFMRYGNNVNLSLSLDQDKIEKGVKDSEKAARAAAKAAADSLNME